MATQNARVADIEQKAVLVRLSNSSEVFTYKLCPQSVNNVYLF